MGGRGSLEVGRFGCEIRKNGMMFVFIFFLVVLRLSGIIVVF